MSVCQAYVEASEAKHYCTRLEGHPTADLDRDHDHETKIGGRSYYWASLNDAQCSVRKVQDDQSGSLGPFVYCMARTGHNHKHNGIYEGKVMRWS